VTADPVATLTALAAHYRDGPQDCPVCNGMGQNGVRQRETTGMVCQRCGWDYAANGLLSKHVDGVIARHHLNPGRGVTKCAGCFRPWPCDDVRELLAVADALGITA
jgi:hypothetical protein